MFDAAVGVGDENFVGHVDEEAGFDDAGDVMELVVEGGGVGDERGAAGGGGGMKVGFEVGVAVVGDEGCAVLVLALVDGGTHVLERAGDDGEGKFDHLDEDGEGGAEVLNDFFLADDDDQAGSDGLDDFFAGEVAAAAFDQVKLGVDLVRTVDGDVEGVDFVQGGEGDSGLTGDLLGEKACRDADDPQVLLLDTAAQCADESQRRAARAQADAVAIVDERRRMVTELFELFGGGLTGDCGGRGSSHKTGQYSGCGGRR